MMYPFWLNKLFRYPTGFTVIEAIIALAITGFLGVGIFTALYQVRTVNNIDNARVTAVKQVENAIHHINRDIQMAQKIDMDPDRVDYWLKLTWTSWEDNVQCKVLYQLEDGNLERQYWERPEDAFTLITAETVARHITLTEATPPNPTPTPTTLPAEKFWTIKITASAPSGPEQADETREIVIIPRPGS